MKLISLNIYGGVLFQPLKKFLQNHQDNTDIFCFQEVFKSDLPQRNQEFRVNTFKDLSDILKNFKGFYAPASKNHDLEGKVDFNIQFGLAIFIKDSIKVHSIEDHMIFNTKFADVGSKFTTLPKNIQIIEIEKQGQIYSIFNLHGIWYPSEKEDTEDRMQQSKKIIYFVNQKNGKKIVCGDFNLMPYTKSIELLENEDLENLIKKYQIKTTRVERFQRHLPKQNFADYTFVSKDIKVKSFAVPNIEVSDHLPMILEFE